MPVFLLLQHGRRKPGLHQFKVHQQACGSPVAIDNVFDFDKVGMYSCRMFQQDTNTVGSVLSGGRCACGMTKRTIVIESVIIAKALMIQASLSAELRNDFLPSVYHLVISTNEVRRNLSTQEARFLANAQNDRIIYLAPGISQRDRAGISTS
jgi:hypothetical protein